MNLHDVKTTIHSTDAGILLFREQEIPDDFLDSLRSQRLASATVREAEFHHVASVPAEVWDMWTVQGLEPHRMTAREIVAKLNKDDLGVFVVTAKRV